MSYKLLSVGTLSTLRLDEDFSDSCKLRGELVDNDGVTIERDIDLNQHITFSDQGELMWGGCGCRGFLEAADPKSIKLEGGNKLTATLKCKNRQWNKTSSSLDLGECIYNINGRFTFLSEEVTTPGCVTSTPGLQLDGNIDPGTFAVASDEVNNRCRIAFKTSFDEEISLAEVAFNGEHWSLPTEIKVYDGKVPGQHIALTYHPETYHPETYHPETCHPETHHSTDIAGDRKTRSLFFSEENGDGYIYQQIFNDTKQKWEEPHRLKANKKATEGIKAHRFTKYAATYYKPGGTNASPRLLLYYVDESNTLQESIGTQDPTNKIWYWRSTSVGGTTIPPKSFLAVAQRRERTYLVFRDDSWNLCLLVGSGRVPKSGVVTWHNVEYLELTVILPAKELLKDSPLAIATRRNGNMVTIFFVKRDGQQKCIYSIDHNPDTKNTEIQFKPKRVGKLEPDSLVGAASFSKSQLPDIRQFSVSNLDGDDILVERIPQYYKQKGVGQQSQWVFSGGVIDTDVDYLGPGQDPKAARQDTKTNAGESDSE